VISRVYCDNYRCFVNFECRLGQMHLLLGPNGSGKTALFDVLEKLRDVVCDGVPVASAFPTDSLTAWDRRTVQTFELEVRRSDDEIYEYRLEIAHDVDKRRALIQSEQVLCGGLPLYRFDGGKVRIHDDDFVEAVAFSYEANGSFIADVPKLRDNERLLQWRNTMRKIAVVAPDPLRMMSESHAEMERPDRTLADVVSWLRHLSQEFPEEYARLHKTLRADVIEGLQAMRLEKAGETTRTLRFRFANPGADPATATPYELSFDALSAGQKNLVAIHAMLAGPLDAETTLCLDEPDNYVALREIQPWLVALSDRVHDSGAQCLLISHHPEAVNYLGPSNGLVFRRDAAGPVRTTPLVWAEGDPVTPAEIVAKGWD
jgi:predicted ATPase